MGDVDKRRYKRYTVDGLSGQLTYAINARVLNMSMEGMAVETNRLLNVDKKYIIRLGNGMDTVELEGTIVWSNLIKTEHQSTGDVVPVFKSGIKFEGLLTEKAEKLLRFIDKNRVLKLEHRLHGRFRIDSQPAQIGYPHDYTIKKLSLSGMLIETDTTFDPGITLEFSLTLDNEVKIITRGRVVNTRRDEESGRYSIGVEFINLSDSNREILSEYLKGII